jgi:DNA-directed RNA polymerase beta subunit
MNKRGYNFVCGETSQQINPIHKSSLQKFMEQCIEILRENNIEVNDVAEQKISDDRIKLSFKMSDSQSNLINYYDTIGYSYCQTKNIQSFKIVEYLKAKTSFTNKHIILVENIRSLYDSGLSNTEIALKSNLKCSYVSHIIRSYKNGRKISTPNIGEFNIDNWVNNLVEEKNNCIFIPIESITEEPNGLVSDIEVESDNHSFIAGSNFLSSNCAMGKQAIGVYATNYDERMDKTAYVLNYPSRPLVDTRVMNFIHLNKIPSGTQIHVAIMTHTGYNQEDSVLINKGSIDRGLFMATIYHTEKDEDKNIIRDEIIRCKPDPTKTKGIKFGNYDKLLPNGFIPENSLVENRDVIIAKTIPIKENRNDPTKTIKYEDQSKTFRTTEETYIDKNYTGRNGDGYNFAKVRVRTLRKPVLGDKFSSRHGQKGTVGNIIPECDMPFTKNGLRPDIIINPHAIPSRMTIGQLKETLLGKVLLELGMFGDGTSFGDLDVKTISEELQKLGYESYGNELMYNGLTGEQLETNIYIGPVFYQRLKHMVNDKQHSRSIGPMVNLTRQPAEGRSRDGGFRIGEMERDVMIAHGMTRFCKERLYDVSDKYSVHVCKKCGMVASYNDGNKNRMYSHADFAIHLCKTCNNMTDFVKVDIPYAYKLMAQELQTINVVPRIITE